MSPQPRDCFERALSEFTYAQGRKMWKPAKALTCVKIKIWFTLSEGDDEHGRGRHTEGKGECHSMLRAQLQHLLPVSLCDFQLRAQSQSMTSTDPIPLDLSICFALTDIQLIFVNLFLDLCAVPVGYYSNVAKRTQWNRYSNSTSL